MYGNNVIVSQHDPPKVYNYTLSGVLVGSVFTDGSYVDFVVGPDKRLYASDYIRRLQVGGWQSLSSDHRNTTTKRN